MTPQDYITNRLAELRAEGSAFVFNSDAPRQDPVLARISELEAMQTHLSQSTRPEPSGGSIGGQYSVKEGTGTVFLLNSDGFTVAESLRSFQEELKRIASDLNQLEALRASHGELVDALTWLHNHALPQQIVQEITEPLLTKAQSLICPTKTPTAAPQGQQ